MVDERDGVTIAELALAAAYLAGGGVAGVIVRLVFARLASRAQGTRWRGDDVLFGALRDLALVAGVVAGAWAGVLALPLSATMTGLAARVAVAVLILATTFVGAGAATRLIRSLAVAQAGLAASTSIFEHITRIVVVAVGLLVLLQTLGVSIAPLLAALGVGGLAVALALQDTLSNLFAGLHILASKKVVPGDYVRLDSGEEGYVVDITWRNTTIRQLPNNLVIVPNAKLASAIVTNFHQPVQELSVLVDVGVSYASDLEKVEQVTSEVGAEVMREVPGGVPEHEPFIRYHTFDESSIGFTVILRAREFTDQFLLKHEFVKRLHRRYESEGIEIPFPNRTVVLREPTEGGGDGARAKTGRRQRRTKASSGR